MTPKFNYQEELSKCSTMEDITGTDGLVQKMIKDAVEQVLQNEIADYIADEKTQGNNVVRNGASAKTLKTSYGNIDIQVPRVREGEFDPEVIKKRSVIEDGLETQIISMYAKGMTVRDIVDHVRSLYGIELSAASISNITDKVMDEAREWYSRTLENFYPVVFLDAIHYKVREEGRIVSKASYVALGISAEGHKDILGIWIGENEGAKFWLKVCNELKNRGVQDILIVCIDGLKGFPDAIKTVFPETRVQLCVIHQIRNTLKYVAYKDSKAFMKDLKRVYSAESEEIAMRNLDAMMDTWKKYSAVLDSWLSKWENLSTYFSYGYQIRRLMYHPLIRRCIIMPKETKLEEVLRYTLESLKEKDYSVETLMRYQGKFRILISIAQKRGISEPTEELFKEYLGNNKNKYTGEYSVLKERERIRVVNLIKSYITNGEVDTSRKKGKSASDRIQAESFKNELYRFIMLLKKDQIQPNTVCTYKRIASYLLIYCEEKSYRSVNEMVSGDIRGFLLYLYEHGCFKPTTITSALSGLKRFLSFYPDIKHLIMELPIRLPRERKIIEIYNSSETNAISEILSDGSLTKRNKAICLLLLETGLRAVDVCNIKLSDIDWNKDIIYIKQQKTGIALNIPLRNSYGNAIVDYILNERSRCDSEHLFVRELAPFTRLSGEVASIREVLIKMEALAGISGNNRASGSRTTRHNAASVMLKSGVPMQNISAVLGHTDPNTVSVYLSTDETAMSACTLPLPRGGHK